MIETSHFYRLKAAMGDLVDKAGGIERAASKSGYSKSTVHRWVSREHPDLMPLTAVLLIERDTGDPIVTRAMCSVQGLTTSPIPASEVQIVGSFVKLSRAHAELAAEVAGDIVDGVITGAEQARIDAIAAKVDEANEDIRSALAAAGGKPLKVVG